VLLFYVGPNRHIKVLDKKGLEEELVRLGWKKVVKGLGPEEAENVLSRLVKEMEANKLHVFLRDPGGCIVIPGDWIKGAVKTSLRCEADLLKAANKNLQASRVMRRWQYINDMLQVAPTYIRLIRGEECVKEADKIIPVYMDANNAAGRTNGWWELVYPPAHFTCWLTIAVNEEAEDIIARDIEGAVKKISTGNITIGGLRKHGFGQIKVRGFESVDPSEVPEELNII